MQMTLTTRDGKTIYLPPEIAIDDTDQSLDIPGVVIPGRHGRRSYGHLKRLEPKTLRASGSIEEMSREEADHLAMWLRSQLLGKGPMKLRRDVSDDRWIEVECTNVNHNPHRGRFRGKLGTFRLMFQADDPFWYHTHLTEVSEDVDGFASPLQLIETENIGDAEVQPIIWIIGRTKGGNHTENPSLHNYSTGRTLRFEGELKEGEVLILDPGSDRIAVKIPDNIELSGTAQGGTANTITLDTTASESDDEYEGQLVRITGGTGSGQIRRIVGYNGTSKVAMVNSAWDTTPDATSQYEVYRLPLDEPYWLYEAQWGEFSGGENALGDMNLDYMINGFPLAPGMNQIEVRGDTEHMHVSIIYRARWY